MSSSVFQGVMAQLREVSDRVIGVTDGEGTVISCTDPSLLGECWTEAVLMITGSAQQVVTFGQKSFRGIFSATDVLEYAVFCAGDDEAAKTLCSMAYVALNSAKTFYEEKHDRGTFVKNIIMDLSLIHI